MDTQATEARRQYMKQYRQKNRERIAAYKKQWQRDNPEKVKAQQARYWARRGAAAPANEHKGKEV